MASNIPRYSRTPKPPSDDKKNIKGDVEKNRNSQEMFFSTQKYDLGNQRKTSDSPAPEINKMEFPDLKFYEQKYKNVDSPQELIDFSKKLLYQRSLDDGEIIPIEEQLEETQIANTQLQIELEGSKKTSKALGEMLSTLTDQLDTATKSIAKKDLHMKEINLFLNLSGQKLPKKVREVQSMSNIANTSFRSGHSEISESNTDGSNVTKNKKNIIRRSFNRIFKTKSHKESLASMKIIYEEPVKSGNSVANISDLCQLLREKELTVADLRLEIVAQKSHIRELENRLSELQKDHHAAIISKRRSNGAGIFIEEFQKVNMRQKIEEESQEIMVSFYLLSRNKTKKNFVGNLLLNKNINWAALYQNVKKIFKIFVNSIDSRSNLGIGSESILTLIVGKKHWSNDKDPSIPAPCSFLSGYHDKIYFLLRGAKQKATDEMAFDLLISNSLLSRYMEEFNKTKRLIFYAPQLSGKHHLACELAEHLRDVITCSGHKLVDIKKIVGSHSIVLSTYLTNFIEKNDGNHTIFVIKDIDKSKDNCLDQYFRKFFAKIRNLQVYIIGTCRTNSRLVKELEMEYKFKITRLPLHMEPLENIISRIIVRDSINMNNSTTNLETDRKVANFLTSTWTFINCLLESNDKAGSLIGPFIYTNCPLNHTTPDWFVQTWNAKIIPKLKRSLDTTPEIEPFEWVMERIPWRISRLVLHRLGTIYKRTD